MLSFKEFLREHFFLYEGIKEVSKLNPNVPVRNYADKLTQAGHKISDQALHALARFHKNEGLTPDHPDLPNVLSTLKTKVNLHGIDQPWSKQHTWKSLHSATKPHFEAGSTKAERAEQGREQIHNDENRGITAFHVKTKEAAQHFYNGVSGVYKTGEEGSGEGGWCVAGKGSDCLYKKQYGSMYTMHHKDPKTGKESWFAVHPEQRSVTSQHNDGEMDYDDFTEEHPKFESTINKIHNHWLKTSEGKLHEKPNELSKDEFNDLFKKKDELTPETQEALYAHKHLPSEHVKDAIDHLTNKPKLLSNVIRRKDLTPDHINDILDNPSSNIRRMVMTHPNVDENNLSKAMKDKHPDVVASAITHEKVTPELLHNYITDKSTSDGDKEFALRQSVVSAKTLDHVLKNGKPNVEFARIAMRNKNATPEHIDHVLKNHSDDYYATSYAMNHPNFNRDNLNTALNHPDANIRKMAAEHPLNKS